MSDTLVDMTATFRAKQRTNGAVRADEATAPRGLSGYLKSIIGPRCSTAETITREMASDTRAETLRAEILWNGRALISSDPLSAMEVFAVLLEVARQAEQKNRDAAP